MGKRSEKDGQVHCSVVSYPIKPLITFVLLACKLACHQGDLSGMLIKYHVVIVKFVNCQCIQLYFLTTKSGEVRLVHT